MEMFTVEIRKESGEVVLNLGNHSSRKDAEAVIEHFVSRMKTPTEFLDVMINDDCYSILHPKVGSRAFNEA